MPFNSFKYKYCCNILNRKLDLQIIPLTDNTLNCFIEFGKNKTGEFKRTD